MFVLLGGVYVYTCSTIGTVEPPDVHFFCAIMCVRERVLGVR